MQKTSRNTAFCPGLPEVDDLTLTMYTWHLPSQSQQAEEKANEEETQDHMEDNQSQDDSGEFVVACVVPPSELREAQPYVEAQYLVRWHGIPHTTWIVHYHMPQDVMTGLRAGGLMCCPPPPRCSAL